MAYSNIRLTLYGLITAIEADLRHAIATDLLIETQPEELLPKAAYERACQRMEQDGTFLNKTGLPIPVGKRPDCDT